MKSNGHSEVSDIHVVEPQMTAGAHAPFNAAMLEVIARTTGDSRIRFSAIESHVDYVRGILLKMSPDIASRITWDPLKPPSSSSSLSRALWSALLFRRAFASPQVAFTSISFMQMHIVRAMAAGFSKTQIRSVLHGDIDRIISSGASRIPRSEPMGKLLSKPNPPNCKFILLGESIKTELDALDFRGTSNALVIDHPYHFENAAVKKPESFRFGFFGNIGEADEVTPVAKKLRDLCPDIELDLVGYTTRPEVAKSLSKLLLNASSQPLDRETYLRRGQSISHALWLSKPGGYRLRCSGTFMDALSFGVPLIYTQNVYLDYYHDLRPEIGYRCESCDGVVEVAKEVFQANDSHELAIRRSACLEFRDRFQPAAVAERVGSLFI